jgi:glycosyltransferase involved in cell wall biosynthesis
MRQTMTGLPGAPAPGRESLLVAAPWVYHPRCGIGGGVLCFRLLEELVRTYDIHFVAFARTPHDLDGGLRALQQVCASVNTVPVPDATNTALSWLVQCTTAVPREARAQDSAAMRARIAQLVGAHRPAAVLLQFPQMAQYASAVSGVPVVMDVQDANTVSRYREWRKASGRLRRLAKLSTWLAWARYERHWYSRMDALLAISESDQGVLRAFVGEVPCFHSPVAADVMPAAAIAARRTAPRYAAFIGNFQHAPNRDALSWLVSEIWPRVREKVADAELHVAGPEIPSFAGAHEAAGVKALGFVESIDAFYDEAAMALVPYRFGGGVKIKAIEAMARGCPVVATTVGAEGLHLERDVHVRVADQADALADAIVDLFRSPAAGRTLAAAARDHVEKHFSWQAKTDALVGILRALASRAATGSMDRRPD